MFGLKFGFFMRLFMKFFITWGYIFNWLMCKIKLFFKYFNFILSLQTCRLVAFRDLRYFAHIKFEITQFIVDSFSECELIVIIFDNIWLLKVLYVQNSLSNMILTFLEERLNRGIFFSSEVHNFRYEFRLKQKLLILKGPFNFRLKRATQPYCLRISSTMAFFHFYFDNEFYINYSRF